MSMVRIADAVRRNEDDRLLRGRGRYLDDVNAPNQARACVLRAPHAHADIGAIDAGAARAAPGVLAVLTGEDLAVRGLGTVKAVVPSRRADGSPGFKTPQPLLARERVRMAGQAVAFVVAETVEQARDAAERIVVDYTPLPALVTADDALAPGAPAIWAGNPGNEAFTHRVGDAAAMEAAFAGAAHVVRHRVCVNRVAGNPMEPRGCLAEYDAYEDRYTLRATIQSAHGIRAILAEQIFGLPQARFRVVCDNMGGGFGTRGGLVDAELALDSGYRFLALRTHTKVPIGAYYTSDRNFGSTVTGLGGLAGVYRTPAIHATVTGAFTNTMTNAQYRGGVKPEPCHVIEVMVDQAARALGVDPARLRAINTLGPDELPYTTCLGAVYDCGAFAANQDRALDAGGYRNFAARRDAALEDGKLLGIGMSQTISGVAMVNYEHAEIRFDSGGGITLLCGAMDHGQGHGTTFRQVLADRLGIDIENIRYRYGDTDAVAAGVGTFNARCAALAGSAVVEAAGKIVEKGKRIAAHMLEVPAVDIEFAAGTFTVAGTDRSVTLDEVARAAFQKARLPAGIEPGLYERGDFGSDEGPTYPNGFHLAEVEIDRETGRVRLVRYNCVDDAGVVLNPLLFDGQVYGGIVQGAGQILMEDVNYDETGQLLTGSFMDYAMPRADDFCDLALAANEVPTRRNPLGVKGVGEAGTTGAMPSVMNAVNDALHRIGAAPVEMPATAEKVWRSIREADGRGNDTAARGRRGEA